MNCELSTFSDSETAVYEKLPTTMFTHIFVIAENFIRDIYVGYFYFRALVVW